MMLQSLLSGLVLFTSFSMRTPNDESILKDDYEMKETTHIMNDYLILRQNIYAFINK